ncbi:hypothetical protein J6590_038837 [Homalodisca vitripennis]|nr:hypothetical protein J6590_038837 [Homalodisca vitripennis]
MTVQTRRYTSSVFIFIRDDVTGTTYVNTNVPGTPLSGARWMTQLHSQRNHIFIEWTGKVPVMNPLDKKSFKRSRIILKVTWKYTDFDRIFVYLHLMTDTGLISLYKNQ